jgi:gliding motility-associatede transport system auxiliary component
MNKKRSALLISVLIVTAIIVVLNWLVGGIGVMNSRIDLTEKKIYTLSDGTRRILGNIKPDEPVTIRFYATQDNRLMPPFFIKYATTVEDLLLEMEKASDNKISLKIIDPRPDSEAEDKAAGDDIAGQQVDQLGNKVYFGLAVECGDRKEIIPSLDPGGETSLEYDIARAIAKVNQVKKPVIGVMSAMPIAGPAMNFPGMRQQGPPPWAVIEQLRRDYEVREVAVSVPKIDADIGILVIIHPADIRPVTEYAIDQFVLRGGKVVAFVDPKCVVSNIYNQQQSNPMMGMQAPTVPPTSTLKNLFKAWGVNFDSEMIVADMTDATQNVPTYLTIGTKDDGINPSEPVTGQLERIQMYSPGAFTLEKKDGVKAVTLLQSSENTMMIDSTTADKAQRGPLDSFRSEGRKRILGLQLTGHFKTAFPEGEPKEEPRPNPSLPNGLPPGISMPGGTGGSDKDAGAPATKDDKGAAPAPAPVPAAPAPAPAAPAAKAPEAAPSGPVTATTPPVSAPTVKAPEPKAAEPAPATPVAAPAAASAPAPAAPAKKPPGPPSLKESTNDEGVVFLFSDADMLYDRLCFHADQFGRPAELMNHNMALLLNVVELLNGGADLIAVRSRGSTKREFTKFQEMSAAVAAKYRPKIEELIQKRNDAEKEASQIKSLELKMDKSGQIDIADPVKKAKLKELNDTSVGLNKELRETRKQENMDKDSLETWITALNLLVVPVLVILFGVALAAKRHALQAAK